MTELEQLRAFVKELFTICGWPDYMEMDGYEFQELGVKYGLLVPEVRHAPCADPETGSCWCAEYYSIEEWAEGITCYRKADWLKEEP